MARGRCGRNVMRGTAFADPAVGVSGRGPWKASARAKLRLRRQRSPSFAVMLPWLAVCRRAALRPVFDSPYALKSAFINVARSRRTYATAAPPLENIRNIAIIAHGASALYTFIGLIALTRGHSRSRKDYSCRPASSLRDDMGASGCGDGPGHGFKHSRARARHLDSVGRGRISL